MAPGTTISLRHRAGEDLSPALRPALVAVHEFAGIVALDAAMTRRLAIVAEELLINLLEYGLPTAPGGALSVALRLDMDGDSLNLVLEDDGVPFDPRGVAPVEMPNPERGGGVGLALVKAFATIEDYVSAAATNRLTLRMTPRREATD